MTARQTSCKRTEKKQRQLQHCVCIAHNTQQTQKKQREEQKKNARHRCNNVVQKKRCSRQRRYEQETAIRNEYAP